MITKTSTVDASRQVGFETSRVLIQRDRPSSSRPEWRKLGLGAERLAMKNSLPQTPLRNPMSRADSLKVVSPSGGWMPSGNARPSSGARGHQTSWRGFFGEGRSEEHTS